MFAHLNSHVGPFLAFMSVALVGVGIALPLLILQSRRRALMFILQGRMAGVPVSVFRTPTTADVLPARLLQPASVRVYGVYRDVYPFWVDIVVRPGTDARDVVLADGTLDWSRIDRVSTWFRAPTEGRTFSFR